jgi:hypothetical protein
MPLTPDQITAVMHAQSALLDLPIAPEHQPGVANYLSLAAGMAEPVIALAATLDSHDESGSIFRPVEAAR